MADGIVLNGDWVPINGDDYDEEQLWHGTQLRGRLKVEDLEAGTVAYYGILDVEEVED